MKLFTALLLLASLNGGAQDRTVYFPEVREHYNIYHPMIFKDTSKTIWVDSLTMRKLKGEYKVVDSVKLKRYLAPRKVIDTTIFKNNPQWKKGPDSAMLNSSKVWPQYSDLYIRRSDGAWRMLWEMPCGKIITIQGVKNKKEKINFSKHCARCKEVFPDRIYFAYESNLEMSNK